ncbi:MAG: HEAT repeat domain-containing protein [Planctomycetota bacterium]|nr:HEAT repeat domain-containing protein [Planctomycetota bacterium]
MFTKDPKQRLRERIVLGAFVVSLLGVVMFHRDLYRRYIAWKIASGIGIMARIEDLRVGGEAMIPYVERYVDSDDPVVRWRAAFALKGMQDPACAGAFYRMASSQHIEIRLMGIDGLAEITQISYFPLLVSGLRDPEERVRFRCSTNLSELVGETFGYDPRATTDEREPAIEKWEAWLQEVRKMRMREEEEEEG